MGCWDGRRHRNVFWSRSLNLARGFLAESRQDVQIQRWRSAVDNAQLAVENAAKAVLALLAPLGRTHNPAPLLREALAAGHFSHEHAARFQRLAECAEELGFDVHVQTDYGDETSGLIPMTCEHAAWSPRAARGGLRD
ncbi:MAG: hypothetical protein C0183_10515, partial [Roseiflexus castenholzii]